VAGVPSGTVVAHKFGERVLPSKNVKQLHDCGIVYYPQFPYVLCVMTRGNDFVTLQQAIKGVSDIVYREFDRQRRESRRF
jgi:hypothetical protein